MSNNTNLVTFLIQQLSDDFRFAGCATLAVGVVEAIDGIASSGKKGFKLTLDIGRAGTAARRSHPPLRKKLVKDTKHRLVNPGVGWSLVGPTYKVLVSGL
jgi:hypothetical protein